MNEDRELETLVRDIARLDAVVAAWDDEQHKLGVTALKAAVERLHREAFRRLIRSVKAAPEGLAALKAAVRDPLVLSVLEYHELLRPRAPSLEERVRAALDEVRPSLATHGGDVALGAIKEAVVEVQLLGSCIGCPSSTVTLTEGVEEAVRRHCPEIDRVVAVATAEPSPLVQLRSPFGGKKWERAADIADIPDRDVLGVTILGRALLLARLGDTVRCYRNACAHLGMPLDHGHIHDDVLTCEHHGFQYLLATGECLTAPEVQLQSFPVRVEDGAVLVRVGDG